MNSRNSRDLAEMLLHPSSVSVTFSQIAKTIAVILYGLMFGTHREYTNQIWEELQLPPHQLRQNK